MILLPEAPTDDLLALEQPLLTSRRTAQFNINGHLFSGILDTGADVSVIRSAEWPPNWHTDVAPYVRGMGGIQPARVSSDWLPVTSDQTTHVAHIKPVVLPLHINLWGRDLMSQFQAKLILQ